jgi:hypothetical protein
MSDANLLSLALQSYQHLFPEVGKKTEKNPLFSFPKVKTHRVPTLGEVIAKIHPLPPQSSVLGVCEDGIPFLLDLAGRETGSLLVTGDPDSEKTRQLQVIVESALRLNSPHEVQIAVLTRDPDEWLPFQKSPLFRRYFLGIHAWYEEDASNLVRRLVSLCEDRGNGRHPGANILLVMDGLENAFGADFEIQDGLHRLLDYGPSLKIRSFASLDAQYCSENPFWLNMFHTFLVGKISSEKTASELGFSYTPRSDAFLDNSEFNAFTGEDWLKYSLPVLED